MHGVVTLFLDSVNEQCHMGQTDTACWRKKYVLSDISCRELIVCANMQTSSGFGSFLSPPLKQRSPDWYFDIWWCASRTKKNKIKAAEAGPYISHNATQSFVRPFLLSNPVWNTTYLKSVLSTNVPSIIQVVSSAVQHFDLCSANSVEDSSSPSF